MKRAVVFYAMGALASVSTLAYAQEVGRVLSSTPVVQQVAVPRQVCNQVMPAPQSSSGGGAVIGAIVGGLLGNTIGHGMGRAAATGVGIVAGAAVGDTVEGRSQPQAMQQCFTQNFYENRTTGYNVLYEYAGRQYNVQLPYDPGPTIRLQVTPVGAGPVAPGTAAMPPGPGSGQPVITAPPLGPTVQVEPSPETLEATPHAMVGQPVARIVGTPAMAPPYPGYPAPAYGSYPVYAPTFYRPAYFYPPIGLSLNFGFSGRHRHWR